MKIKSALPVILAILSCSFINFAQSEKQIVEKYKNALQKTLDQTQISSIAVKATFTIQKLKLPARIFFKSPHLMRVDMEFQGLQFIYITNDSVRWEYNPMQDINKITKLDNDKSDDWTKSNSSFDFIRNDLINYKDEKHSLKLLGREKLDSLEVYILKLTTKDKEITKFFIDTKTFLIIKIEDQKGFRYFGRYASPDGFTFPRFLIDSSTKQLMEMSFDELAINNPIPDSLFVIPKSAFENKSKSQRKTNDDISQGDASYEAGKYKEAVDHYTEAIKEDPESFRAYNSRGLARLEIQEYYEAIADFTKALEIDPSSNGARNNIGLAKFYLGDYNGAIKDYSQALQMKPTVTAYKNRGLAYLRQKKYTEAKNDFAEAIKIAPEDGEAHFKYGVSIAQLEQYQEAIDSYQQALKFKYTSDELFNYKGVSEYKLERYDSASKSFARAMTLNSENLQYLENYGNSLYRLGDYDNAVAQFEKYLERNKDNAEIHNMIGLCKYGEENYQGAIHDFSKAIKLGSTHAVYYDNRASAKELIEDYEGAIQDYTESIRIYPNDGSVFYKRGLLKLKTSRKLEGCADLGTAHDMKYEEAKEAIMNHCH